MGGCGGRVSCVGTNGLLGAIGRLCVSLAAIWVGLEDGDGLSPLVGGGGHVGVLGWVIGDGFHRVGDMVVEHGGVFAGGIGVCPGCAKTVGDCCWRVPARGCWASGLGLLWGRNYSRAACVVYRRDWGVGLFMLGGAISTGVGVGGVV